MPTATQEIDEQLQETAPLGDAAESVQPLAEIPNEAIDRPVEQEDGTNQEIPSPESEVAEDPEAWRVVRFSDDPAELTETFARLEEQSPAFKRSLHSYASARARAEAREKTMELEQKAAQLEREKIQLLALNGNLTWGRMTPEQRAAEIVKDPQNAKRLENWQRAVQQAQQASQPQPRALVNTVASVHSEIDRYAAYLTDDEEAFLRQRTDDPATQAHYAEHPSLMLEHMRETIANFHASRNNAGTQSSATPRQAAPVKNGSAPRNPQTAIANPAIGKQAPDSTPRRGGGSGVNRTYTKAEIDNMTSAEYADLKKRANATTGQELVRRGIIVG